MIIENADCVDFFKQIKDESVDLIVCDPPYKITARGNCIKSWISRN
uniref:Putative methyltransferase n=1 Tax=Myoviridae sp. ctqfO1 TaxID=2827710 RepID=A0A8S5T307_9CAUD|nr:MAG TPA: putative methyltransferase [Myoviridae sp. ctqfO1]